MKHSTSNTTGTFNTTGVATMHIGVVAQRTGLSLRTLRHYDEVDLLRPSGRTDGGFRLYAEPDIDRLMLIRRMKPLGFTLEEMAELLSLVDELNNPEADEAPARTRLHTYIATSEQRRAELARKLEMADEFITVLQAL